MASRLRKCEICREWIDAERLEAVQNTRLCGEHAERIQAYGGEFTTVATVKSTAKAGSMKPNPTDVMTRLVRNHEAIENLRRDYEEEQYGG